jgi:hypothetical protein
MAATSTAPEKIFIVSIASTALCSQRLRPSLLNRDMRQSPSPLPFIDWHDATFKDPEGHRVTLSHDERLSGPSVGNDSKRRKEIHYVGARVGNISPLGAAFERRSL